MYISYHAAVPGIIYLSDNCKLTNEILIATLLQVEPKNRQWVKVGNFDNLTSNVFFPFLLKFALRDIFAIVHHIAASILTLFDKYA